MHQEGLSYRETAQQFEVPSHTRIASWERIYLTQGAEGFQVERRGRDSKGRLAKLPPKAEEDLLAEVQRLMKKLGLVFRVRMKSYRAYKDEVGKIAPNLLERHFAAEKPNQKWVTDVAKCSMSGQKLYLLPILDLGSRDIVSDTISDRLVLSMITSMREKAFQVIPDGTRLTLHSDQG